MSRQVSSPPPADPLLKALDRLLRRAHEGRAHTADPAARRDVMALSADLALLLQDLRAARLKVRAELDTHLAKSRAGDAYRRTGALRSPGGGLPILSRGSLP